MSSLQSFLSKSRHHAAPKGSGRSVAFIAPQLDIKPIYLSAQQTKKIISPKKTKKGQPTIADYFSKKEEEIITCQVRHSKSLDSMWDVLLEEYGETSTKEVPVFCKVQQSTPLHDAYESLLDEYIHNDKEKPVFCKVRLSKPLDTYLDLLSDMDENDEETPVLCTVRKTQPISYLWQTMLTEFGIQETVYQNKRKHTENGENNKRQRVSTKDLCRFINLHMCIS